MRRRTVPTTEQPWLLTLDEARGLLQIGRDAMTTLVKTGEVPSLSFGKSIRINREALMRYINQRGHSTQAS